MNNLTIFLTITTAAAVGCFVLAINATRKQTMIPPFLFVIFGLLLLCPMLFYGCVAATVQGRMG
jgi:hypothetical protein